MNHLFQVILCWFGFHSWVYQDPNFTAGSESILEYEKRVHIKANRIGCGRWFCNK